jgi:hypothetical protein
MGVMRELLVGMGSALATTAGLFTLQLWYASYLDVAVVHGDLSNLPVDAKLQAVRSEERGKLAAGPMPIAQAMEALAQRGRSAFPKLATKPSADLSAMSGWIHKPGFRPYVPRRAAVAAADGPPRASGAEAPPQGSPAEGPHAR